MTTHPGIAALRRADPRDEPGFAGAVEMADALRDAIVAEPVARGAPARRRARAGLRPAVAGALAIVAVAAVVTVAPPAARPGSSTRPSPCRPPRPLTGVAGGDSGTAVVRITRDGEPWAGKTVVETARTSPWPTKRRRAPAAQAARRAWLTAGCTRPIPAPTAPPSPR